jgi:hypothetical protein
MQWADIQFRLETVERTLNRQLGVKGRAVREEKESAADREVAAMLDAAARMRKRPPVRVLPEEGLSPAELPADVLARARAEADKAS